MAKSFDPAVILAMAECNLNVSKAAKILYMDRTTVLRHIDKIHDSTGRDPRYFYDLVFLLSQMSRQEYDEFKYARKLASNLTDQTLDALERIGRKSHGGG